MFKRVRISFVVVKSSGSIDNNSLLIIERFTYDLAEDGFRKYAE